jgi:ferritin-like metal-binding protein YciE
LAAIERISHYGLAIYTSIDRYLRTSGSSEARKVLQLSLKEKREAIDEMESMACREFIPKLHKKRKQVDG